MAGRREVNVDRPEHSWIPFYRELAEKLVDPNEGWRGRQDELMDFVREMALDEIMGVPRKVADCEDPYLDPFSLFACFSNSSKGEKRLLTMQRVGEFFGLQSKVLHADFYVPEVYSVYMLFWTGENGYKTDVEKHWDLFECIMQITSLDEATDNAKLVELMDASLDVIGVRATKLSSAFYWINPFIFLERKTINGVLGNEVVKEDADASAYLEGLALARRSDARPFPVVNDEVYLRDHTPEAVPKVWMVRGGREESAVELFLSERRVGIGFNMDRADLSEISNRAEIESAYRNANKEASSSRVGQNVGQIKTFVLDMKVGDYVIMPVGGHVRYGAVTSRPYHDPDVIYENNRSVAWYEAPIPRERLSQLPPRRTVSEVKDQLLEEFWSWVRPSSRSEFQMPEDSWVPFHLEVGRKLMEGEWWLPEKREALDDMIEQVRWSDPDEVSDDYEHIRWTPDPYSFYLSFNMRTDGTKRLQGYRKVQELLDIDANVPDADHRVRGLGTHYRFTNAPGDDDIDALWDFFRFVIRFDPAEGAGDAEFVEKYDRVIEVNGFVGQWDSTLSYWLYWIDPRKYLLTRRLHRQELGLAEELGLPEHISGGQPYLEALRATRSFAASKGMSLLDINRDTTTPEMLGLDSIEGLTIKAYTIDDMVDDDDLFFEPGELRRMHSRFEDKKNLILQGPPGVGKTFVLRRLAYALMGEQVDGRIRNVQFHQSYSYEEFVQGYRPSTSPKDQLIFKLQDGTFKELCDEARKKENEGKKFVMVIDEINRGNLSRVFGELLSMIEKDKRGDQFQVRLAGGNEFSVPENVYILGTMNLADRSLAGMDYAMRRRFAFVTLEPQFGKDEFLAWLKRKKVPEWMITRINDRMKQLNEEIAEDRSLGRNFAVGHSYFCDIADGGESDWDRWYREIVKTEIQPLLEEYWFDDPKKAETQVKENLLDGVPENGESNDNRS